MTDADRPARRGVRTAAVLCAVVLLAGLLTAAYELGAATAPPAPAPQTQDNPATVEPTESDEAPGGGELADELAPIAELYSELTSEAVEPPDREALVEGAMEGMVEALEDPYSSFYDSGELADFNEMLDGTFSGVGLVLEEKPEGLFVVSVIDGTPAAGAGVEEGEQIVSVDGENVRDAPIEQVVTQVKGKAGTDVTLGLEGGSDGPREVTLTRAEIEVPIIEQEVLHDGAGYVSLWQFTEDSGDDVREAVTALVRDEGVDGIVLDLRGNPGGLLREAVDVASIFIESGAIVSVEERGDDREVLKARGDAFADLPLVVLVDGGSASASEIVAGAVADADRGTLVGERTFGKGTVQTIHVLDDGSGVKFTTARYFTPSGESIEEVGIKPDRLVKGEEAQLAAAQEVLASLVATASG